MQCDFIYLRFKHVARVKRNAWLCFGKTSCHLSFEFNVFRKSSSSSCGSTCEHFEFVGRRHIVAHIAMHHKIHFISSSSIVKIT